MTEILHSPSHFPSPTSSSPANPCAASNHNDSSNQHVLITTPRTHILNISEESEEEEEEEEQRKVRVRGGVHNNNNNNNNQLSVLALFVAGFRKSLIGCSLVTSSTSGCGGGGGGGGACGGGNKGFCKMEIGLPSDVRHVAHVTFDRFDGFLGLPVEFEPEVPRRAPSASATVFGVSTDSMQLSYDSRGNSVPTILLQMQRHLYSQGGLQAEGIFRINADNGQEEHVRDQLNRGVVPEGVDVHCLAGLIKAWFRELPTGVLDSLEPEQVIQAQSEEDCAQLVRLLPPMEAALLDWALNLMADVAQLEHLNKMNARNVAMVFAPNMTKMDDPLTALMYAVQVMNFLKTLIVKTIKERGDSIIEPLPPSNVDHPDDNGHESNSVPLHVEAAQGIEEENLIVFEEPADTSCSAKSELTSESESQSLLASIENIIPGGTGTRSLVEICPCEVVSLVNSLKNEVREGSSSSPSGALQRTVSQIRGKQSVNSNQKKEARKIKERTRVMSAGSSDKNEGKSIVGRLSSRSDLVDAWR